MAWSLIGTRAFASLMLMLSDPLSSGVHRHLRLRAHLTCMGVCNIGLLNTGGRLNKKDGLTRYGDSHVKDKTS